MSTDTSTSHYSEPPWSKNPPGTELPWYVPNIDKYLTPVVTDMLQNYSKIPHDKLSTHLHAIRDKTYAIRSYPTVGVGAFITPYIATSPAYDSILTILKTKDANFLDIGAMLGVDMRKLTVDGVPSENLTGVDIVPEFWDVGYDLYRDRETFKARHIYADVLSLSENPALDDLKEKKVDVISISAVLHQFDWDAQVAALKQVLAFSKVGSMVMGHQIGNRTGGPSVFGPAKTPVFVQSEEHFRELWKQVSKETDTEWAVEVKLRSWVEQGWDAKDMAFMKPEDGPLDFVARRVS